MLYKFNKIDFDYKKQEIDILKKFIKSSSTKKRNFYDEKKKIFLM